MQAIDDTGYNGMKAQFIMCSCITNKNLPCTFWKISDKCFEERSFHVCL